MIYIYPRGPGSVKKKTYHENGMFLNLPKINISSTMIRNKINLKSKDVHQYLNSEVLKYITKNNIY